MYVYYTTDWQAASVGRYADALALIVFGFLDMVDLHLCDALSR
jgi:hypothetical protein